MDEESTESVDSDQPRYQLRGLRSFPGKSLSPERRFPEKTFPGKTFPGKSLSRKVVSRKDVFPERRFPESHFPGKSFPGKVILMSHNVVFGHIFQLPPVDNMIAIMTVQRKGAGRLSEMFCTTRLCMLIICSAHRAVFKGSTLPPPPK